jgi:hypothetical protein
MTIAPPAHDRRGRHSTTAVALAVAAVVLSLSSAESGLAQTPPPAQIAALTAPIELPGPVPRGFTRNVFAGDRIRQKVFIPSYRVAFTVAAGTRVQTRGTDAFETQRASASAALDGIDEGVLKAITERAYLDFVERLTQAGFEVVPVKTWRSAPGADGLQTAAPGVTYLSANNLGTGHTYALVNPAALTAWPESAMPVNLGPVRRMTGALDATMLAPRFNVNFAYLEARRGRSFLPGAPQASLTPGIHGGPVISGFGMDSWRVRVGQHGGFMEYKVDDVLPVPGAFDLAQSSGTQSVDTSGARMWGPREVSVSERYLVDPEAYTRLALQALALQNQVAVDELARARR